jgi:predicted ATP-grasp superfamily ATP-dependent carboligase
MPIPSSPPDARRVRVLVTGGDFPGALAAVRSLRRMGFAPWAVASRPSSYVSYSRAPAKVVLAPNVSRSAPDFVDVVARACSDVDTAIVIPGTEPDLVALVEWGHLLPESVVGVPAGETLRRVTDKLALAECAVSVGFSTPPTKMISRATLDAAWEFPYVVKPLRSVVRHGEQLTSISASAVATPSAARRFLDSLGTRDAVAQSLIRGRLHSLAGVMWNGRLLSPVQQVALSVFPRPCGGSAVARTVTVDPSILERVERLLRELNWQGIVQLQWLDDGDKLYVIDVNPRIYGSLALANASGSPLAVIWTRLLLGLEIEETVSKADVVYRNFETSLRSGGRVAVWPLKGRNGTTNSVFSFRDPVPVLATVRRGVRKVRRDVRTMRRRTEDTTVVDPSPRTESAD